MARVFAAREWEKVSRINPETLQEREKNEVDEVFRMFALVNVPPVFTSVSDICPITPLSLWLFNIMLLIRHVCIFSVAARTDTNSSLVNPIASVNTSDCFALPFPTFQGFLIYTVYFPPPSLFRSRILCRVILTLNRRFCVVILTPCRWKSGTWRIKHQRT